MDFSNFLTHTYLIWKKVVRSHNILQFKHFTLISRNMWLFNFWETSLCGHTIDLICALLIRYKICFLYRFVDEVKSWGFPFNPWISSNMW